MKLQSKHCLGNWDTIWTAHIGKIIYVRTYLLRIPSSSFFFFVSFLFTGFAWLKSHSVPDYTHTKKYAEFAFLFCIHWGINFSVCHLYFTGDSCCLKLYLALHFNFPHLSIWKLIFFFKSKFLNKILGNLCSPCHSLPTCPLFFTLTTDPPDLIWLQWNWWW